MMMRRLVIAVASVLFAVSLSAQRNHAVAPFAPPPPGEPLSGISEQERDTFKAGHRQFAVQEFAVTGLGPVFNNDSCLACHAVPTSGGGDEGAFVTRVGTITDGKFDPLTRFGGSVMQAKALIATTGSHRFESDQIPRQASIVARRRSPPLFGLGLVDATPDATFFELAHQEELRGDGTAGQPNMVDNVVTGTKSMGKFGWKAQIATLLEFAGDALLNELGITNPLFPNENCPSGNCAELEFNPAPGLNDGGERLNVLADYMRFLAPPPRLTPNVDARLGELVFSRIGCDACHVATLQTGSNASAAFDRVTYHPYSDFLLHDMGPTGDGLEQGSAGQSQMRTAPLWGVRFLGHYLHDGRARTFDEAIAMHNGQARAARDRFLALSGADRQRLIMFLRTL